MIIITLLLCVLTLTQAERMLLGPPNRMDLKDPPGIDREQTSRNVLTSYVQMPLDHFDPLNTNTYTMRYMYSEQFFGGAGSPIFIFVGGEWAISTGWLNSGNMYEMARENNGYMVYTEHRYYGTSLPYTEFTTENLRYLNVEQALADLALFIVEMKKQDRFANSKVILYGCSYAANMALWFKQRYTHLIEGVVATCGPILGKVNYHEYLEVVHNAFLSEGDQECIDIIEEGIKETSSALRTAEGRQLVKDTYGLCEDLDAENPNSLGYFSGLITWTFSGAVQYASPGSIGNICNNFKTEIYGDTPMRKIAGYLRQGSTRCWANYDDYIQGSNSTSPTAGRAWYYQTCTEYAYFQVAPSSGTVFDSLEWLSVDFYVDTCEKVYSTRFDKSYITDAVDRSNVKFGGLSPDVNNTINVHGKIDPWHALGVHLNDIKEGSPTMFVSRASHCFDLYTWQPSDTVEISAAKQNIRRLVAEWLN